MSGGLSDFLGHDQGSNCLQRLTADDKRFFLSAALSLHCLLFRCFQYTHGHSQNNCKDVMALIYTFINNCAVGIAVICSIINVILQIPKFRKIRENFIFAYRV